MSNRYQLIFAIILAATNLIHTCPKHQEGVFLRLKGFPITKNDIDIERKNRRSHPEFSTYMDQKDNLYHDFPLESCGSYEYFGYRNGYGNKVSICEKDIKSSCKETITSGSLSSWIQMEQGHENCPEVAAFDENPKRDFTFYSSVGNSSGKCK